MPPRNPMPTLLPLIDPELAIGPVSITRKEGRSKSEPVLSLRPAATAGCLGTWKVGHLAALWRSEPGEGSVAAHEGLAFSGRTLFFQRAIVRTGLVGN